MNIIKISLWVVLLGFLTFRLQDALLVTVIHYPDNFLANVVYFYLFTCLVFILFFIYFKKGIILNLAQSIKVILLSGTLISLIELFFTEALGFELALLVPGYVLTGLLFLDHQVLAEIRTYIFNPSIENIINNQRSVFLSYVQLSIANFITYALYMLCLIYALPKLLTKLIGK